MIAWIINEGEKFKDMVMFVLHFKTYDKHKIFNLDDGFNWDKN